MNETDKKLKQNVELETAQLGFEVQLEDLAKPSPMKKPAPIENRLSKTNRQGLTCPNLTCSLRGRTHWWNRLFQSAFCEPDKCCCIQQCSAEKPFCLPQIALQQHCWTKQKPCPHCEEPMIWHPLAIKNEEIGYWRCTGCRNQQAVVIPTIQ